MISLFLMISGFGYGTYSYITQSIEKIETTYEEEQDFVTQSQLHTEYKEFLASYAQQPVSGAEKILPTRVRSTLFFDHLSTLGEVYGILTSNFKILSPSEQTTNYTPPHTDAKIISFDFIGTYYTTKEFVSRIEEVLPLTKVRSLDLTLDETQVARGSMTLEILSFNPTDTLPETISVNPTPPELLPAYNYLYDLTQISSEKSGE